MLSKILFRITNKCVECKHHRSFQSSCLLQGGGGGGRPGGVPTFTWKQKKILQLEKKKESKVIPNYGSIELLGDISKYTTIDLSKTENYGTEVDPMTFLDPSSSLGGDSDGKVTINHTKVIQARLLFGSHKPAYAIPLRGHPDKRGNTKRKVKLAFSHSRIFGHKKSAEQSA